MYLKVNLLLSLVLFMMLLIVPDFLLGVKFDILSELALV